MGVFLTIAGLPAAEVKIIEEIVYREAATMDAADRKSCALDLYLPADGEIRGTLVWLHGGGLTGGSRRSKDTKALALRLAGEGIAVASADYRLNPQVQFPLYLEDSAAAYAWVRKNIATYGGDAKHVFLGGHSAGAYLALMIALDEHYLAKFDVDVESLAGVVAVSGQTISHFTVRAERGVKAEQMTVDDGAPLFHVKKRSFPFLIFYASDDMALRIEENRLLAEALRRAGSPEVFDQVFAERTHSSIIGKMVDTGDPAAAKIIDLIARGKMAK